MHGNYQNQQNNIDDKTIEKAIDPVEESAAEELKVSEPEVPVATESAETLVETPEKKNVLAIVVGCAKLNVREKPDGTATVLTVIPVDSEVMVDLDGSTGDFYKVCTAVGIEGFCMKQYLAIR